jgi:hypothetical protein
MKCHPAVLFNFFALQLLMTSGILVFIPLNFPQGGKGSTLLPPPAGGEGWEGGFKLKYKSSSS